jgi:CheY-like chemotaxis protein
MNTKIGIVDDNKVFRNIYKLLILKSGFVEEDILLFENGKEAFDFITKHIDDESLLPKTLFLDLNMPVMDGWKFLKLFHIISKHHNYNPNIYILTSSVDPNDLKKVKSMSEVNGYLVKPINETDFYKILHNNNPDKFINTYL